MNYELDNYVYKVKTRIFSIVISQENMIYAFPLQEKIEELSVQYFKT